MRNLLLIAVFFFTLLGLHAQDKPAHPSVISTGTFLGVSKPLRDLPVLTPGELQQMELKAESRERNEELRYRSYPFASTALPKGPDPVWQKSMGTAQDGTRAPLVNFNGQDSPYFPPDCNGVAGPNHFMQTINCVYAIYSKTGTLVAGPTNMNLLFSGVPGATYNDGDPIILYDEQADRWLATEFSISGGTDYVLMAVSTTNDPTGTWYKYSFAVDAMPDYPKFSVWRDGYYMGDNNSSTRDIYVFERSKMLLGQTAQAVGFNNPYRPASTDGFMCVPPIDNDGAFAPAGSPGLYIAFNDDGFGGGTDQLWIYELTVNWTTPASSTFTRSQQINVPAFDSNFGSTWDNIAQQGTARKLDAIPQVIMNVPQYRNFGAYQTIVCCHTVDVDNSDHAGIRWYELRRTTGAWSLRQTGTYAPDAHSRWMGSIMLNGSNKIALGYSVSSSTMYPGIRYCGQSAGAYASASGTMDIPEEIIQTGGYSQTAYNRWGDYSLMSVDPTDDGTFWFTSEYIGSGGSRKTKIASFRFGNSPSVTTIAATDVTGTSATLNGTVNPNGLSTDCHFEWGTTVSYGNSTPVVAAGSGTTTVNAQAAIDGLTAGLPYHFRLTAVNSDGTTNGNDMTFTPGAAAVTTAAITAVTMTTATSGGNVTTDGGSPVTARGVCWSTSANPIATGNHTTDGSGLGSFTSAITGLSANTTYHVRAYATNGAGAFYGEDLQFTTLCGTVSTFPYNEGFENGGIIPACWSKEYVTGTLDWTYQSGGHSGHPAAAHGGSYNAFFYEGSYGTNNVTKLVTPAINLGALISPQLKFWHAQAYWTPDQDELRIYYKTTSTGSWNLLATYTANITTWTQETITLPNPSPTYFIAFQGTENYGYGVCLDDVSITGTAPTLTVTPANQNVTSAAGTTNFTITSNTSWTALSNDPSWCLVPASGSGNGTLTATYAQNTTYQQRIATITVTVNGLTPINVTVTQAAAVPPPPSGLQASVAGNKVQLTWVEPQGGTGLTGYNAFRGAIKLTPVPIPERVYNDNGLDPGTYDYTITAVYGDLESAATTPVSVSIVATTVSLSPDRTGCQGDTIHVPVHITGVNLDSLVFYINYDHSLLVPGSEPYTLVDPRFTVAGFFPDFSTNTMAISMKETGTAGADLSGDKLMDLVFNLVNGGVTTMLFKNTPDPAPVSVLFASSGIEITPVTYSGNTVNVTALPAAAGTITGPGTVDKGTTGVAYFISAIDGATDYVWNLPPGASIASGAGTANITVDFSSTATSGVINVVGSNGCGNGTPSPDFPVTVNTPVPALLNITNATITAGQPYCYDATDTITIAGNGAYFIVEAGGSVTFISGNKIIFLPDAIVQTDGYLYAYITETSSYCGSLPPAMVKSPLALEEKPNYLQQSSQGLKVYPNPTTGRFILEYDTPGPSSVSFVRIYGIMGEMILRDELNGAFKKEISLEGKPAGIYILNVIHDETINTVKIIKQ